MYQSMDELPQSLTDMMPVEAQKLYITKFNESWQNYEEPQGGDMGRRGVAHRNAISALRDEYVKGKKGDIWYPRGEVPETEEEDEGFFESLFSEN